MVGGSATRSNSWVHAWCQGQWLGRCGVIRRRRGRDPCRDVDRLAAVAVVAVARSGEGGRSGGGDDGGDAGEVGRGSREHEPGAVGGELPGEQVRQRGALEVGVDLFDDGVPAVGLVGGDGVERSAGAVVKNAWKRHTSNKGPPARRPSSSPRTRRGSGAGPAVGHPVGLLLGGERRVRDLGDLAFEIHAPVASSKIASGYLMAVRIVVDSGDRGLDRLVHPDGDRRAPPVSAAWTASRP